MRIYLVGTVFFRSDRKIIGYCGIDLEFVRIFAVVILLHEALLCLWGSYYMQLLVISAVAVRWSQIFICVVVSSVERELMD